MIPFIRNLPYLRNSQFGFAVLPVLILAAALGGVLAGVVAIQRQANVASRAQSQNYGNLQITAYAFADRWGGGFCDVTDQTLDVGIGGAKVKLTLKQTDGTVLKEDVRTTVSNGFASFADAGFGFPDPDSYIVAEIDYPEPFTYKGVDLLLNECGNSRNKPENVITPGYDVAQILTESDFGNFNNKRLDFRAEWRDYIPPTATLTPSPSPTVSPTPTSVSNQCPSDPYEYDGGDLPDCTGDQANLYDATPDPVTIDPANWPDSVNITWNKVPNAASYRMMIWYHVGNDEFVGILTGWPTVVQENNVDVLSKDVPRSKFDDEDYNKIVDALAAGKTVKLRAMVRANFDTGYNGDLTGRTQDETNKACFCRSAPPESPKVPIPGSATLTPTPTADCSNCYPLTDRRHPRSVWDGNDENGPNPALNNDQVDNCTEACLAFWGPECSGPAFCPQQNDGSTNPAVCCECQIPSGEQCSAVIPTAPPPTSAATTVPTQPAGATCAPKPGAPTSLNAQATNCDTNVTFSWNSVPGTNYYKVFVNEFIGADGGVNDATWIQLGETTNTSLTAQVNVGQNGDNFNKRWKWRVETYTTEQCPHHGSDGMDEFIIDCPANGGATRAASADLTCDGIVNSLDMSTALANYRETVSPSCQGSVLVTVKTYLEITNLIGIGS